MAETYITQAVVDSCYPFACPSAPGLQERMEQIQARHGQHDPERQHDVIERHIQSRPRIFQLQADHELERQLEQGADQVPDFAVHRLPAGAVVVVPMFAVCDQVDQKVDEEDGVVDPHGDEDDEPGPAGSLVQTKD